MGRLDQVCEELVQFIGLGQLDPLDQERVYCLAAEYYPKIARLLKGKIKLVLHIKRYELAGRGKHEESKRCKYSLHCKVIGPTKVFVSCRAHDWELTRALHKTFKDVRSSLAHAFHRDVSGRERHRGL